MSPATFRIRMYVHTFSENSHLEIAVQQYSALFCYLFRPSAPPSFFFYIVAIVIDPESLGVVVCAHIMHSCVLSRSPKEVTIFLYSCNLTFR